MTEHKAHISIPRHNGEKFAKSMAEKKSPAEAKGDCTICKGWVDDGGGGMCVFSDDYWSPNCPYEKE